MSGVIARDPVDRAPIDDDAVERDVIERDIVVPPECGGWRLDHFLKRRIGRMSRTRIQSIIGEQISFPDGRPARPSSPVRAGETILLRRPAPVEPEVPRHFDILFEDESVLVIDKPAGLPMHTTAKFWRNTLVALLRERYPDEQMEIAHRIDRETSGVLLIARNREVASVLTRAFARRTVEKTYLALVKGHPPDEGKIDVPLRLLDTKSRVMMGPAPRDGSGLTAVTQFRVVRRLPAHALCEARPLTGRQHQIRVHFASIGHPIVGDKLYGASEALFMRACEEPLTPELLACFDGLPRHALHAHRLTFPHPVGKHAVTIESPLPADLAAHVASLA